MNNKPIVFIDSGLGGLSTLACFLIKEKYNIVYFADNKFAPYGSLSKKQLQNRLKSIILDLKQRHDPIGFVLACNTATTSSISYLRREFKSDIIIGTEPAVSLAIKNGFKKPRLIATPQTIKNYKKHKHIKGLPLHNFARNIEAFLLNNSPFRYYLLLKDIFYVKRKAKHHDSLVLGCTHYALIKDIIAKFIQIPMFDGNEGVSNEIRRKFIKNTHSGANCHSVKFEFSNNYASIKENYKKILKQILANQQKLC